MDLDVTEEAKAGIRGLENRKTRAKVSETIDKFLDYVSSIDVRRDPKISFEGNYNGVKIWKDRVKFENDACRIFFTIEGNTVKVGRVSNKKGIRGKKVEEQWRQRQLELASQTLKVREGG